MPKVTQQRNGRMRSDKISTFCSITHPRFVEHSSTPENPTSPLVLLMESKEVPLEKSNVHGFRGGKVLLNSLGYETYGTKE